MSDVFIDDASFYEYYFQWLDYYVQKKGGTLNFDMIYDPSDIDDEDLDNIIFLPEFFSAISNYANKNDISMNETINKKSYQATYYFNHYTQIYELGLIRKLQTTYWVKKVNPIISNDVIIDRDFINDLKEDVKPPIQFIKIDSGEK